MWKKRSRVMWLKEGDQNTTFFHNFASERKEINSISGLLNSDGVWTDKEEEMKEVARSYFEKILQSSNPDKIEEVLDGVEARGTSHRRYEFGALSIILQGGSGFYSQTNGVY